MKMTASLLALACAATLPLASVAHAATPESATTVSAAQSQTILEVSASGKLSEIGAAVLGPDVRLTVRLHGPIAFDVDTANFASLEIYADDAAATLTVSEPTAYDRLTAVSFPKASGSSATATTFATAATTSAGVATLAEGDTTAGDGGTIPNHLSVNVKGNVSEISDTSVSGLDAWQFPDSEWVTSNCAMDDTISFSVSGVTATMATIRSATGATPWHYDRTGSLGAMGNGYRDGPWEVAFSNIPYDEYTLVLYFGSDMTGNNKKLWNPVKITKGNTEGIYYTYNDTKELTEGNAAWGSTDPDTVGLGTSVMAITGLSGDVTFGIEGNNSDLGTRSGLYGFQIINTGDPMTVGTLSISGEQQLGTVITSEIDFATVDLTTDAVLTIDRFNVKRLNIVGPETGTATIKVAADIDLSKIDLSEAPNVNIVFVSGCSTVSGGLQVLGDVTVSTPVTLTVDSVENSPYWSVVGTLTIGEGGSLTVAVAEGVTVTSPIQVIKAQEIVGTISPADDLAGRSMKVTCVGNVYWLTGSGTLRATISEDVNWDALEWKQNDGETGVDNPVFDGTSDVVLTFTAGATLTIGGSSDGSSTNLTFGSLAINNTSSGSATIAVSENVTLAVANQVTIAGGEVELPVGILFDATSAGDTASNSSPADKPAFTVAAGATVTLTGDGETKYIRKEPISGGGTVVKSSTIPRLDLYGQDGQNNLDGVTLKLEGGGLKLVQQSDSIRARLKDTTVVYAGTDPRLILYGWAEVAGTVTFVSETAATSSLNNSADTSFVAAATDSVSTLILKKGESAPKDVTLPRIILSGNVAADVEGGVASIKLNSRTNCEASGTVTVYDGATLVLDSSGATNGAKIKVCKGGTIKPVSAPTLCYVDLELEDGAIFDRSVGAIDIGGKTLVLPESGTVNVTVAADMTGWDTSYLIKTTSTGVLNADNAKKFAIGSNMGLPIADHFIVHKSEGFGFGTVVGTVPSAGSILGALLRDAAIENGSASAMVVCGGTLTADKAEAGVERFTHVTTTATDSGTTTITVAYDFGISKMAIRDIGETRYVIVGAKVQGAEGADFAETTAVQVLVNGTVAANVTEVTDETGTTGGQSSEAGVKWFRLPYADVVGGSTGTFSLTVKALPQTTTL